MESPGHLEPDIRTVAMFKPASDIIYHRIGKPRWINVIICEPVPGEYVWMSMYLRPDLRNGSISKELVRYILHLLPGNHHIHFFPEITTLRRLARDDAWQFDGKSRFYVGCLAFQTRSLRKEPGIGPLLRGMLSHERSRRRPWLPTFKGPHSASRALRRIARRFNENGWALRPASRRQ
jgi:hypothetical protein